LYHHRYPFDHLPLHANLTQTNTCRNNMHTQLALFCLFAVSFAAPLTDRQKLIQKVWGEDVNVTLAESIIADEAKRFGVSNDEYFNTCTADADKFELTPEEKASVEQEKAALESLKDVKIENKDQLLKEIGARAPKTLEIVNKRIAIIDKYVAKLNPEAQKFAKDAGNAIEAAFVSIAKAQSNPGEMGMEQIMNLGAAAKKIYSDYQALSQSAKDSLDQTFCINATIRIVKSQIEQFFMSIAAKFS
ncbi:hypothetical protein PENTCL1PPCAC_14432, partial [Pristionchus entomophagus]